MLDGAQIAIVDHTLPLDIARKCPSVRHVVFLGTGPRSYMNPEELAGIGITVHTIKGYGDTAVAECAIALMWVAARGSPHGPRDARRQLAAHDALQLTGRTIGLIGFGGIAAEVARLALGAGIKVLAWNRTPKTFPGISFVSVDALLAQSDVVSLHLFLCDETEELSVARAHRRDEPRRDPRQHRSRRPGRRGRDDRGDESGHLRHAGLDVYTVEPMPAGHRADNTAERHAVRALRVSHRRGESQPDRGCMGALQKDCEEVGWAKALFAPFPPSNGQIVMLNAGHASLCPPYALWEDENA